MNNKKISIGSKINYHENIGYVIKSVSNGLICVLFDNNQFQWLTSNKFTVMKNNNNTLDAKTTTSNKTNISCTN